MSLLAPHVRIRATRLFTLEITEVPIPCPPDDIGGVGGFYDYLEALADPKHDRHDELLEWGGPFDPEAFDAARATKEMRRGLPSW
ncbi:MAG: IS1096 element passenger TnpR family protein [Deltaproteobacteria bacterium]